MSILKPVLESVVEITQQREMVSLSSSLVTSIHQLLNVDLALMLDVDFSDRGSDPVVIAGDGREYGILSDDAENAATIVTQIFGPQIVKFKDAEVNENIEIRECTTSVFSVFSGDRGKYLLCIKIPEWTEKSSLIISGVTKVFSNYLKAISDSEHDSLTGLLNRKFFHERLNTTIMHSRELSAKPKKESERRQPHQDQSYWLCIFDIDHFKLVNDRHGHLYGDGVLIHLSTMMKDAFRNSDLLFRYGGEEFIVVVGSMPKTTAMAIFERFRDLVENGNFGSIGQVTISLGVVKIDHGSNPTTIVGRADQALYFAKENGRNQMADYEDLIARQVLKNPEVSSDIQLF